MPEDEEAFKVKCLPLVVMIQMTIFTFIYITTDNYLISGNDPILDLSILFLIIGVIVFFVWQKSKNEWPFNKAAAPTKTVAVEMDKLALLHIAQLFAKGRDHWNARRCGKDRQMRCRPAAHGRNPGNPGKTM